MHSDLTEEARGILTVAIKVIMELYKSKVHLVKVSERLLCSHDSWCWSASRLPAQFLELPFQSQIASFELRSTYVVGMK